jgi:hypothetical protein
MEGAFCMFVHLSFQKKNSFSRVQYNLNTRVIIHPVSFSDKLICKDKIRPRTGHEGPEGM